MIPKYTIEFSASLRKGAHHGHYSTDDPIACEEFIEELLERGYHVRSIKHDGLELPRNEFDRLIKAAAGMMAARHICASLGIKPEEEKFRFGFAA
jgi:hypothetical protein